MGPRLLPQCARDLRVQAQLELARPVAPTPTPRQLTVTLRRPGHPLRDVARVSRDTSRDHTRTHVLRARQAQMLGDQTLSEERRKELIDAGYMSLEEFQSRVGATLPDAAGAVLAALEVCVSEIEALERLAEERFEDPDDQPNLFPLRSLLGEMCDFLGQGAPAGGEAAEGVEAVQQTDSAPSGSGAAAGPIGTRQDALRRLREVEDYFRRVEPHSPISYLIGRAVSWGNMSFEELLRDLARDKSVLGPIWETLGLDNQGGEDEE